MKANKKQPGAGDYLGWMQTTWSATPQPPFFVTHFTHPARVRKVRRGSEDVIEAEWFDNDPRSRFHPKNKWRSIAVPKTATAIYQKAIHEREQRNGTT